MARRTIRDVTPLGIKAIDDNFIDLSYEVFGNSTFSKKLDGEVKKNKISIDALTTTVGDLDTEFAQFIIDFDAISLEVADKVSSAEFQVLAGLVNTKVTAEYVQDTINTINQRGLNLVSNLASNWIQVDTEQIETTDYYGIPVAESLTIHSGTGFQCEYTVYYFNAANALLTHANGQLNGIGSAETRPPVTGATKIKVLLTSPSGVVLADLQNILLKIESGTVATSFSSYPPDEGIDLSDVYTRLDSAEQKITPTAIVNAVETKIGADGSAVLATKGDLTLTSDNLTAKFSTMGIRNLMANTIPGSTSLMRLATAIENVQNLIATRANDYMALQVSSLDGEVRYRFCAPATNNLYGLVPGQNYTISGEIWSDAPLQNKVFLRSQYYDGTWKDDNGNGMTDISTNTTGWVKFKKTFTIPVGATGFFAGIEFFYGPSVGNITWVRKLKWENGEVATDWVPYDGEGKATYHIFDANGYTMKDSKGDMLLSPNGVANEQNIGRVDNVEDGYPLKLPFNIGLEVSQITQAKLKWDIAPFRTYSKGSASGGGSTSGGGGSYSSTVGVYDWAQGNAASTSIATITSSNLGQPHYHTVSTANLSHRHNVSVPSHVHSTPNHAHSPEFGILEIPVSSNWFSVFIDGINRASVDASRGEIDLSAWITTNGWHTIELKTASLKRIDANLFLKTYIRR